MTLNEIIKFANDNNIDFNQDVRLVDYDPRVALSHKVNIEFLSQIGAEQRRLYLFASCFVGESVAKNPDNNIPGMFFMEQPNGNGRLYYWEIEPTVKDKKEPIDLVKEKFSTKLHLEELEKNYKSTWGAKLTIGKSIKEALYEKMPSFFKEENAMIISDNTVYIGEYKYRYEYNDIAEEGLSAKVFVNYGISPYTVSANFYDDKTMKSKFESILGDNACLLEYHQEVYR